MLPVIEIQREMGEASAGTSERLLFTTSVGDRLRESVADLRECLLLLCRCYLCLLIEMLIFVL